MTSVYKRDLRAWFTSVSGYFFLTAFLCVINFVFFLYNILAGSAHLGKVFSLIPVLLMLGVPLLTMRSFAGDFEQKTDRLLLTSPTSSAGIVLGKFLCCFTVFAVLPAFMLLWPLILALLAGRPGLAAMAGNLLGLLCLGAAYISIGIFISSLTQNKSVAATGSLGAFLALYLFENWIADAYADLPAWLLTGFRFASLRIRYETILSGILFPADLLYLLSVCFLFLFLTVQSLERRHWA